MRLAGARRAPREAAMTIQYRSLPGDQFLRTRPFVCRVRTGKRPWNLQLFMKHCVLAVFAKSFPKELRSFS